MTQSLEVLNVLVTSILKQVLWKTKPFLEKMYYHFLLESVVIGNSTFPWKTFCQKLMLGQIECL